MEVIAKILIGIVAMEHLYIMWMEMFAWETVGKKTFRGAMPKEMFSATKVMAANQGLYNGFLAAGLIWSLLIKDILWSNNVAFFFLSCVALAGSYGGYTIGKKVFIVQALPAIIAILVLLLK